MSQLGFVYDEFKKDGFEPRMECMSFGPNDDLSILLHPEAPECLWFSQWQRQHGTKRVNFWSLYGGRWVLVPR